MLIGNLPGPAPDAPARGNHPAARPSSGMAPTSTLRDEPLPEGAVHLCVDMQRLFLPGSEWGLEWMPRVLPRVVALCEPAPAACVFTRFIPARRPGEGQGVWARYYTRWASMTLEAIGTEMVELVPELARFAPPAAVVDKPVYSPWLGSDLHRRLQARGCTALLVSGGETDMCVLAAVLGAADLGYRTILVSDAVCSTSDAAHDAMLALFSDRYGQHVEVALAEEVLDLWPPGRRRW
jgi:nicotinamidase-related amidase